MMLKTAILALFVLVNLAVSRSLLVEEDICETESKKWEACFNTYKNKTITLNHEHLASTVSPGNQHITNLKDFLTCVGKLHCKGQRKLTKFQLDTVSFVLDRVIGEPAQCAQDTRGDLPHCVFDHTLVKNSEYNGEILTCAGNLLEATECTEEEKRVLMGAARAQNDFLEIVFKMKKEEIDANLFDETFDPTKYD
ncbi:hypothetical protein CAEBREN_29434 [Caenorhabditis brenneri]|uniref:DUF19 domain-containing protein n=1 Tax=Caenorhabditis brenneri TaxID=135651 RepID=G0M9N8_CAEBE|nr:hypothetical protein CAEBREN_29434 [Caenorhabditis brenneri]